MHHQSKIAVKLYSYDKLKITIAQNTGLHFALERLSLEKNMYNPSSRSLRVNPLVVPPKATNNFCTNKTIHEKRRSVSVTYIAETLG